MPRGRKKKTESTELDPNAPFKCKECDADLTDVVLPIREDGKSECPYCHAEVKLPKLPKAAVKQHHEPPADLTPKPESYGLKAQVIIPYVSDIEVNKIGTDKNGLLITKISFQCQNVSEISLLRIIHMMKQHADIGVMINAERLQTDFFTLVDPKKTGEYLVEVSRKDLESKGIGVPVTEVPTNGHKETKALTNTIPEGVRRAEDVSDKECLGCALAYTDHTFNHKFMLGNVSHKVCVKDYRAWEIRTGVPESERAEQLAVTREEEGASV